MQCKVTIILPRYAISASGEAHPSPTPEAVASPPLKTMGEHTHVFGKHIEQQSSIAAAEL